MQVHAVVIRAIDAAQERHAVLGRTVARTHDLAPTTGRRGTINSGHTARGIFPTVICYVQPNDWCLRAWRRALHQYNLRNAAILAKIIAGAQGRYQLESKGDIEIGIHVERCIERHTSSLAKRGPMPTTYTTLRCTTLTLAR